jgi:hypothetical protein
MARNIDAHRTGNAFMTRRLLLIAALLLGLGSPAFAQRGDRRQEQRPESFEALIHCRAIAEDAARLHCFDSAAAALEQAAERRDIVVVDRNQVRETRRRLFGFALPAIRLFGGGGRDEGQGSPDEEVREIHGVAASASERGGRLTVTLEEGAVWTQIDDQPLAIWPRRGTAIVIRRGLLGNFMMEVAGQPGIRVRRIG